MKYLINNSNLAIFAYDINNESQKDAYDKKIQNLEYFDCRLPQEFEIWDSITHKWVLDVQARDNAKVANIKSILKSLIDKYQVYTIPFQFNKLKPAQQEALRIFLEECDNLLKRVTVDTKIPEIPEFLKDNPA